MKCEWLAGELASGVSSTERVLDHVRHCDECRKQGAMAGLVAETASEAITKETCNHQAELAIWWNGSLPAHAVPDLMAHVRRRGMQAVAMNFRGCSGRPNRLARSTPMRTGGSTRMSPQSMSTAAPSPIQ